MSTLETSESGSQPPRLLDRVRAAIRLLRQEPRGHVDVKTTMIYTHVLTAPAPVTLPVRVHAGKR